jgi:hypothetical protein
MSSPPDNFVKLSETLTLCEYTSPRNGSFGFWLYDETRGMNLSMRAKTERVALVEALEYYQERLIGMEKSYADLKARVDAFVEQFVEDKEDGE